MKTTPAGILFIQNFEKLSLTRYLDEEDGWTIGWGHLIKKGESIPNTVTKDLADKIFVNDLSYTEEYIQDVVEIPLTFFQFDALVSLVYNIGTRAFRKSTLLKLLNKGRLDEAADEFPKWKYDSRKVVKGLYVRRMQERDIFKNGIYTFKH